MSNIRASSRQRVRNESLRQHPSPAKCLKERGKSGSCNAAKSIEPVLQPASADDDTEISRVFFTQSVTGQRRISRACDRVEEKTG
jgi:hypothetical protein